jgi:O-antigen ligase
VTANARDRAYLFAWAIFALLFLRPYPATYIGAFGVRLIDMLMLIAILTPPLLVRDLRADTRTLGVISYLFALTCLALVSATIALYAGFSTSSPRDLFESLRYLNLACYLLFGFFLGRHERFEASHLTIAASGILILAILFSFAQRMSPSAVTFLTNAYAPEHQALKLATTRRLTSFFGNPNTNGVMMLCLLVVPLAYAWSHRASRGCRIAIAILAATTFLTIIATGSRTAFITILISSFVVPLLLQRFKLVLASAAMLSAIFATRDQILEAVSLQSTYLASGLKTVLHLDFERLLTEGTFARRLDHWREALQFFEASPLIGAGPLRARVGSSTDNFYIYVLARYGALGLGLFAALWHDVFRSATEGVRHHYPCLRFLGLVVIMLFVAVAIANLTIEAQIIPSIASIYFVTFGILLGRLHSADDGCAIDRLRHHAHMQREQPSAALPPLR